MNIKLPCLIALAALAWSPIGVAIQDIVSPRTGAFTLSYTVQELLGEKAGRTASVIPPDETVSWDVYVPEDYRADEPAGVVVFISPSNSGSPRRGWSNVMDERNLIWISANRSGNRVFVPRRVLLSVLALVAIQQEYVLDGARVYIAGFSGGGRVASMVSTEYAGTFKGGIFISGVEFWDVDQPRLFESIRSNKYVFLTGEYDHALESTKRTYRAYRDAGVPDIKLLVVQNLGHEDPPRREISKAIEFLDSGSADAP
jgi:hypothetical protein